MVCEWLIVIAIIQLFLALTDFVFSVHNDGCCAFTYFLENNPQFLNGGLRFFDLCVEGVYLHGSTCFSRLGSDGGLVCLVCGSAWVVVLKNYY